MADERDRMLGGFDVEYGPHRTSKRYSDGPRFRHYDNLQEAIGFAANRAAVGFPAKVWSKHGLEWDSGLDAVGGSRL